MARTAEGVGFDSLWLGDHLLYDLPGGVTRGGPVGTPSGGPSGTGGAASSSGMRGNRLP